MRKIIMGSRGSVALMVMIVLLSSVGVVAAAKGGWKLAAEIPLLSRFAPEPDQSLFASPTLEPSTEPVVASPSPNLSPMPSPTAVPSPTQKPESKTGTEVVPGKVLVSEINAYCSPSAVAELVRLRQEWNAIMARTAECRNNPANAVKPGEPRKCITPEENQVNLDFIELERAHCADANYVDAYGVPERFK